jgi:hypothetical protein
MAKTTKVIFREEQRWWTYWRKLCVIMILITVAGIALGIYFNDMGLIWFFSLIFLPAVLPICVSKMTTEIREDGIYIYYFPWLGIWAKRYPAEKIGRVEAKIIFHSLMGVMGFTSGMAGFIM